MTESAQRRMPKPAEDPTKGPITAYWCIGEGSGEPLYVVVYDGYPETFALRYRWADGESREIDLSPGEYQLLRVVVNEAEPYVTAAVERFAESS